MMLRGSIRHDSFGSLNSSMRDFKNNTNNQQSGQINLEPEKDLIKSVSSYNLGNKKMEDYIKMPVIPESQSPVRKSDNRDIIRRSQIFTSSVQSCENGHFLSSAFPTSPTHPSENNTPSSASQVFQNP